MSITIWVTVQARAEHARLVENELGKMVDITRTEPGCLRYELYRAGNDANTFHLIESYTDQTALDQHAASTYFLNLVEKIGNCLAGPLDIKHLTPLPA